ncbi:MAG: SusD/RagB family nutrient-binding outer membrane lipoprotein [Chitinophagales bacterium]|nr:SusD/RagB family nutrient-binding outer membrane lipoprotein [Chitinophagales bacterium]
MKLIKNIVRTAALTGLLLSVNACNMFDLDVNTDPINPSSTTPNLLLTNAENILFANLAGGTNYAQHGFMGMISSNDDWNVPATSWNGYWNSMYANVLKDLEGVIEASVATDERAENPHYLGIAQLLKAYTYVTMVDQFGDVPFSEALKGNAETAIKFPKFDKDEEVYRACRQLVEDAIVNLNKTSGVIVEGDIVYNGDIIRWKKFANTFKLKMAMTTRLVNPAEAKSTIEALISAGELIGSGAEDFQFQFSKTVTPDNRHPWYQGTYTGGEFTYISHQMMVEMLVDGDPRFPFYFRRQTKKVLDPNNPTDKGTIPCVTTPGCTYGYLVANQNVIDAIYTNQGKTFGADERDFLAGIFGRDRSDPAGVPADGTLRTIPGVYPCGGYYDVATPGLPAANAAPGGGIHPALTHINVLYYRIEAALALGAATGDPRTLFEEAIRKHIAKVSTFGVATDLGNAVAPSSDTINQYVAKWLARYDAAPDNNARLNVVMKQMWFSSWGNATELWNAFRRTGLPTTLQEPINPVRDEPKRMPYPQQELTLNPSAAPYINVIYDRDPIFWDKN